MALVVSEKMASIARLRQVICVTHLPQIAAMADANFLIRKYAEEGATHTTVARLTEEEATDEIARLAGGIETASSENTPAIYVETHGRSRKRWMGRGGGLGKIQAYVDRRTK